MGERPEVLLGDGFVMMCRFVGFLKDPRARLRALDLRSSFADPSMCSDGKSVVAIAVGSANSTSSAGIISERRIKRPERTNG